jgi:hypothetical protein
VPANKLIQTGKEIWDNSFVICSCVIMAFAALEKDLPLCYLLSPLNIVASYSATCHSDKHGGVVEESFTIKC